MLSSSASFVTVKLGSLILAVFHHGRGGPRDDLVYVSRVALPDSGGDSAVHQPWTLVNYAVMRPDLDVLHVSHRLAGAVALYRNPPLPLP